MYKSAAQLLYGPLLVFLYYNLTLSVLYTQVCILDYAEELRYWGIRELNLEICCIDKFNTRREAISSEIAKQKARSVPC